MNLFAFGSRNRAIFLQPPLPSPTLPGLSDPFYLLRSSRRLHPKHKASHPDPPQGGCTALVSPEVPQNLSQGAFGEREHCPPPGWKEGSDGHGEARGPHSRPCLLPGMKELTKPALSHPLGELRLVPGAAPGSLFLRIEQSEIVPPKPYRAQCALHGEGPSTQPRAVNATTNRGRAPARAVTTTAQHQFLCGLSREGPLLLGLKVSRRRWGPPTCLFHPPCTPSRPMWGTSPLPSRPSPWPQQQAACPPPPRS